jgi:EAL domain-containing protein (putative c-di-GMP-specific phosphodiesterase class I)
LLLEPQTAAGHLEAPAEFAREVGRLGCRLALDDFGIGSGRSRIWGRCRSATSRSI